MPTYTVQLLPRARRALRQLDRPVQRRIVAALDALATNPRPPDVKALTGQPGELRVRTGDYRIVYEIQDDQLLVLVVRLGHRRDVYRGL